MRYFQWTIGSTTVRNPDRLRDGLKILNDFFKDKIWNLEEQENFFNLLKEKNIYEMDEENYGLMTSARKQEHARKWVSVLNQLGFCYAYQSSGKPVFISAAGEALLNNPDIEDEIFLRQLLKFQKPCALPKQNGDSFRNVCVIPFVLCLKITHELNGLSKEEISIFLNTTIKMEDISQTIDQIKQYRENKAKLQGPVRKKQYYNNTQIERLRDIFKEEVEERMGLIKTLFNNFKKDKSFLTTSEARELLDDIVRGGKGPNTTKAVQTKISLTEALKNDEDFTILKELFLNYFLTLKSSTLKDYADLTVRYLRKSGLFSISKDRLILISDKEILIETLLSIDWGIVRDDEYLSYLWSSILPKLPSDEFVYLSKYFNELLLKEKTIFEKIRLRKDFEINLTSRTIPNDLIALKQQVRVAEQNLLKIKEIDFYYSQGEETKIKDILNFYDMILGRELLGEAYYPAYLEWNTWRVFLAINTLFNKPYEARNFKIDSELQPIDDALGNMADMCFEYKDFLLVTEVTLKTGPNQWSAEAEPVPRHVAKIQFENRSKEVFGLFVAPKIDPNTILTFFNNRKYSINNEIIELTIIPFTIDNLKFLLSTFNTKKFSTDSMRELFFSFKKEIDQSEEALEWHNKIPGVLEGWAHNL